LFKLFHGLFLEVIISRQVFHVILLKHVVLLDLVFIVVLPLKQHLHLGILEAPVARVVLLGTLLLEDPQVGVKFALLNCVQTLFLFVQ
jgi:hypothetical protein